MQDRAPLTVGIDLGTTYSLVACLRDGVPVVLPNALGEGLTPSAVGLGDDGTILVGAAARARRTTHPDRTLLSFKRDMGTDRRYRLGTRDIGPQECSALVLDALRRDAEAALGAPVEEAVVTVPAYFGDKQRQATRDAAAIAGLRVERIINEPTAAALAYGLHRRGRETRAVVLDLGGGTFDVTVLEILEGVIEIQASAGDARLGGDDFDEALATEVARRIRETHGLDLDEDPRLRARLRDAAEAAKRRLGDAEAVSIALPNVRVGGASHDLELTLDRATLDSIWQPLLERANVTIARALRDAGARAGRIDDVLLVGGSTRLRSFVQLAAKVFGRLPDRSLPPDEAVVMGACVQAALKAGDAAVDDLVVTDVAPFTLGISTVAGMGRHQAVGVFAPIIERGTVIPVSREEVFSTVADGQRQIRVEVYQGEHSLVRDNQKLGEFELRGLSPKPAGEEHVAVRFTYDLNGILEVEMQVASTGAKSVLVIERTPGRLTAEDVEAARRAMQALKLHPRAALPNTVALARADALYAELTGPERAALGEAIASFRAAMETQDAQLIVALRERLAAMVASLRR